MHVSIQKLNSYMCDIVPLGLGTYMDSSALFSARLNLICLHFCSLLEVLFQCYIIYGPGSIFTDASMANEQDIYVTLK